MEVEMPTSYKNIWIYILLWEGREIQNFSLIANKMLSQSEKYHGNVLKSYKWVDGRTGFYLVSSSS